MYKNQQQPTNPIQKLNELCPSLYRTPKLTENFSYSDIYYVFLRQDEYRKKASQIVNQTKIEKNTAELSALNQKFEKLESALNYKKIKYCTLTYDVNRNESALPTWQEDLLKSLLSITDFNQQGIAHVGDNFKPSSQKIKNIKATALDKISGLNNHSNTFEIAYLAQRSRGNPACHFFVNPGIEEVAALCRDKVDFQLHKRIVTNNGHLEKDTLPELVVFNDETINPGFADSYIRLARSLELYKTIRSSDIPKITIFEKDFSGHFKKITIEGEIEGSIVTKNYFSNSEANFKIIGEISNILEDKTNNHLSNQAQNLRCIDYFNKDIAELFFNNLSMIDLSQFHPNDNLT